MDKARFGNLVRSRREDAGLGVQELADRVKLSREVLGKFERGQTEHPMDPDNANLLAAELRSVSVLELVMAMGYQVAIAGLSPEELALVEEYRRLDPARRAGLQATARALAGMLQDLESA